MDKKTKKEKFEELVEKCISSKDFEELLELEEEDLPEEDSGEPHPTVSWVLSNAWRIGHPEQNSKHGRQKWKLVKKIKYER